MKTTATNLRKRLLQIQVVLWLIILPAYLLANSTDAIQEKKSGNTLLILQGKIRMPASEYKNVSIDVLVNGIWTAGAKVDEKGYYSVVLQPGELYTVKIQHKNYISETIVIDTHLSMTDLSNMKSKVFYFSPELLSIDELLSYGLTKVSKEIPFVQYNQQTGYLQYNALLSEKEEVMLFPTINAQK